jgi:hypothetical protein
MKQGDEVITIREVSSLSMWRSVVELMEVAVSEIETVELEPREFERLG